MDFEWDDAKSAATSSKRGFDFVIAARIFNGSVVDEEDRRKDYGERRVKAIGKVDSLVLAVVYTDRGDIRRIISARVASRKERELWRSSEKL